MRLPVFTLLLWLAPGIALAANPQDEATVRHAYAKLAYAVQSKTVYVEVQKHPDITSAELAQKLQANELRFEITEMTSGALSQIASRPYSDFVTRPESGQDVLQIASDTSTFDENRKRATSNFANPNWVRGHDLGQEKEIWDTPVKAALRIAAKLTRANFLVMSLRRHRPLSGTVTHLPHAMAVRL